MIAQRGCQRPKIQHLALECQGLGAWRWEAKTWGADNGSLVSPGLGGDSSSSSDSIFWDGRLDMMNLYGSWCFSSLGFFRFISLTECL
jgi:hypothetical protein